MFKEFECDDCMEMKPEPSDNINGHGRYCGECIDKRIKEDMEDYDG